MEPLRQVEIQLGHMCNNRCVFCVSGQETALGRARPLAVQPILDRLSEAWDAGHRKLTLLGGEPTLQPGFFAVLRHAVALGFEEIVLFTNGVKTARESYVEEVIAEAGGRLTWRISIQGATEEAHERTTRRPGSFGRIVESMGHLHARGQRLTVNMCVVQSNYESVPEFPALLARFGARQLHLDMVRPLDAGARTEEEFAGMIPRYAALAGPLRRMVAGFPAGFDVNIGNLPYCVAPDLAAHIHHDGEATETITVDSGSELSRPWNKYFVKRRDKGLVAGCAGCVFAPRCSGVFDKYREVHGEDEFRAVTPAALVAADPERLVFWAHLTPLVAALSEAAPRAPFTRIEAQVVGDREGRVSFWSGAGPAAAGAVTRGNGSASGANAAPGSVATPEPDVVLWLRPPRDGGVMATEGVSVHLGESRGGVAATRAALAQLAEHVTALGGPWVHPPGDDALPGAATRSIAGRVARLRAAAPFGRLSWQHLALAEGGSRAELTLEAPEGAVARLWLGERAGAPVGGYTVEGEPTPALVEGLRAAMACLRGSAGGAPAAHRASADQLTPRR